MRKYFIMDFYLHHKVSIIFIILICTILLLIATFIPYIAYGKNIGNAYESINSKLGNKFYSILFIFVFIVLSYDYAFLEFIQKY